MAEIDQMPSPIAPDFGDVYSPQFVDVAEPLDMLHIFDKMAERDFSKQVYGEKTIDFGDFDMEADQVRQLQVPKDAKRR